MRTLVRDAIVAGAALAALIVFGLLHAFPGGPMSPDLPLWIVLIAGGAVLVSELAWRLVHGQFGSDLLAGLSIVTAALLDEPLAGVIVVLMLSGGQLLEAMAVGRASRALQALARRMPALAHRTRAGAIEDVPLDRIAIDDEVTILPHEICPVDGVVLTGHGTMDESYLTGEPFVMAKGPGALVLSGAINGEHALTVRATHLAENSRYARIMRVMRESEQRRPRIRRLGDQLGAIYTPIAVAVAVGAWVVTGNPLRFLAVLVVATPCPLLIGIPVAIVGSISLAARRGIVIRDPAVLERIDRCRTMVLDKTGTLTFGRPTLTETLPAAPFDANRVLQLAASLEQYSRHPLAAPVLEAARQAHVVLLEAENLTEAPGEGLTGTIDGRHVRLTGRRQAQAMLGGELPAEASGLECVVIVDDTVAAVLRFRDAPRAESRSFVTHLSPRHHFERILIVSGDREREVRYLAEQVGVSLVHAGQSPEDKVRLTSAETAHAPTVFVGDGINDAPALAAATVGIAFGQTNEIAGEAAGAVILDTSLKRVDELLHVGRRMRRIALESAVGGIALSVAGMVAAAAGLLPPVAGAVVQEGIDLAAVLNALRAALPARVMSDYER